jgi:hypothetical protein
MGSAILILGLHESGKEAGDHEQGEEGGNRQAADDRDAQGLPGDARQGYRDDANDGAKRSDEDGFEARFARVNDRFAENNAVSQIQVDLIDEDDRVFYHDAE